MEGQTQPLFAFAQGGFGLSALYGIPGTFGNIADKIDFIASPGSCRRAVDGESSHTAAALHQYRFGRRDDITCELSGALIFRESWIVADIVHDETLSAGKSFEKYGAEVGDLSASGKRGHIFCIGHPDDELPSVDVDVENAVDTQVFTNKARCRFLNFDWVIQWSDGVDEPEEEFVSQMVPAHFFF